MKAEHTRQIGSRTFYIWLAVGAAMWLLYWLGPELRLLFVSRHPHRVSNGCLANLRQIEGAKQQWALEHSKAWSETPADTDVFGPARYLKEKPICFAGGVYSLNAVAANATCSIGGMAHTL